MSAPTDAIDRFCERDLEILFDDEVQASTIEVHRSIERLSAEQLRLIGEFDRRQTYTVAGHPSTASWLAATCRLAWGHGRRLVGHARFPRSHWADGGPTRLDNQRLLCRHHHRLVHEGDPA
ncbi:MAG: HNH endonuclease [Acidobacteria bacterium]|nr:HNH endonuclease [Acidobacteriota bacterium]